MAGNPYNAVSLSLKLGKHKKDKKDKNNSSGISPFSLRSGNDDTNLAFRTISNNKADKNGQNKNINSVYIAEDNNQAQNKSNASHIPSVYSSSHPTTKSTQPTYPSNGANQDLQPNEINQKWPPSLVSFVNRSYISSSNFSDYDKVQLNNQLQDLLGKALNEDKIFNNNWDNQKLPILDKLCKEVELECNNNIQNNKTKQTIVSPVGSESMRGPQATKRLIESEYDSNSRKKQRMTRFSDSLTPEPQSKKSNKSNKKSNVIIGTCKTLEKNYLRLTSEPDPSKVRPERILFQSMHYVLDKYRKEGAPYSYLNNQFKSIRQDLTVQHIKNDLTLRVYEAHARIAIENCDLGEFNQCQSQLKYLYFLKKQQSIELPENFYELELEFTCYRILYMLMMGNHSEVFKIKFEIYSKNQSYEKPAERELFECIEKAFRLQNYLIEGDYHHFFLIYDFFREVQSMKLGYHLIKNFLINKERIKALHIISKSYRRIPISFLVKELKFENKDEDEKQKKSSENIAQLAFGEDNIQDFFVEHNLSQFILDDKEVDCVAARGVIQAITVKSGFRKIDIKGQV